MVLEDRRRKRRCLQVQLLLRPGEEDLFLSLSACVDGCLLFMSSHCLALCVCIQMAPSYSHYKESYWIMPTLRTSL